MIEKLVYYNNGSSVTLPISPSERIRLDKALWEIQKDSRFINTNLDSYLAAGKQDGRIYFDTVCNGNFVKIFLEGESDSLYFAWLTLFEAGKKTLPSSPSSSCSSEASTPRLSSFSREISTPSSLFRPTSQKPFFRATGRQEAEKENPEIQKLNNVVEDQAKSILNLSELLLRRNDLSSSSSPLQGRVEELQERLSTSLQNEETLQEALQKVQKELEQKTKDFEVLQSLYEGKSVDLTNLQLEQRRVVHQLQEKENHIQDLEVGVLELTSKIEELKKEHQEEKSKLEIGILKLNEKNQNLCLEKDSLVEEMARQQQNLAKKTEAYEKELTATTLLLEELNASNLVLKEKGKKKEADLYKAQQDSSKIIQKLRLRIQNLEFSFRKRKQELLTLENSSEKGKTASQNKIADLQSKVDALENLIEKITQQDSEEKRVLTESLQSLQEKSKVLSLALEKHRNQDAAVQEKLVEKEEELGLLEQEIASLEEKNSLQEFLTLENRYQKEEIEEENKALLHQIAFLQKQLNTLTLEKEALKAATVQNFTFPSLPPLNDIEEEAPSTPLTETKEIALQTEEDAVINQLKETLNSQQAQILELEGTNAELLIEVATLKKNPSRESLILLEQENTLLEGRLLSVLEENREISLLLSRRTKKLETLTQDLDQSSLEIQALQKEQKQYQEFLEAGALAMGKIESLKQRLEKALEDKELAENRLKALQEKITVAKKRLTPGETHE